MRKSSVIAFWVYYKNRRYYIQNSGVIKQGARRYSKQFNYNRFTCYVFSNGQTFVPISAAAVTSLHLLLLKIKIKSFVFSFSDVVKEEAPKRNYYWVLRKISALPFDYQYVDINSHCSPKQHPFFLKRKHKRIRSETQIVSGRYLIKQTTPELKLCSITSPFVSLMNAPRQHRYIFYCIAKSRYPNGVFTFNSTKTQYEHCTINLKKLPKRLIKDFLFESAKKSTIKDNNLLSVIWSNQKSTNLLFLQAVKATETSAISIVSETMYSTADPQYSEKVMIAIAANRPFILIAPARTLALLRALGFRTFSAWFPEDYDLITNPTDRLVRITEILDQLYQQPISELKAMVASMKDVLSHNRRVLSKLTRSKKLGNRIIPRYALFADKNN